jgi:hypothetical protein
MYISSSTITLSQSRVELYYSISSILLFEGSTFFATLESASLGSATSDFLFSVSLGRLTYTGMSARCAARVSKNDLYIASHLPIMPLCI